MREEIARLSRETVVGRFGYSGTRVGEDPKRQGW